MCDGFGGLEAGIPSIIQREAPLPFSRAFLYPKVSRQNHYLTYLLFSFTVVRSMMTHIIISLLIGWLAYIAT